MRPVNLSPRPMPGESLEDWVSRCFVEINAASNEQPAEMAADAIEVLNLTELTSFDVSAATLDELRQIVGTLIAYIQRRGPNNGG